MKRKKIKEDISKHSIKEGYYTFLLIPEHRILFYKCKKLETALRRVLQHESDNQGIDHEAQIFDKNKQATDIFINLYNLPDDHPVQRIIV